MKGDGVGPWWVLDPHKYIGDPIECCTGPSLPPPLRRSLNPRTLPIGCRGGGCCYTIQRKNKKNSLSRFDLVCHSSLAATMMVLSLSFDIFPHQWQPSFFCCSLSRPKGVSEWSPISPSSTSASLPYVRVCWPPPAGGNAQYFSHWMMELRMSSSSSWQVVEGVGSWVQGTCCCCTE